MKITVISNITVMSERIKYYKSLPNNSAMFFNKIFIYLPGNYKVKFNSVKIWRHL